MSRKENIKTNLIFSTIKFSSQIILRFVLRTALIYIMGSEYLGLNGLFSNIFSFLNLAELGIGGAIVFSMYKPIAENDTEKVKALQQLYKKFYLIIAIVVAVLGLGLLPFLSFFIKGGTTVDINIYVLYLLYLANAIIGYFSAHKRSLLFAYQRCDVENKIKTLCLTAMSLVQIVVLFLTKNYYVYFIVNIIFTIVECVSVQVTANKMYPQINGKSQKLDTETKKEITKNVAALSLHKIGGALIYSTDNIIISALLGVVVLGAYSNYYLIITSLISVFTLVFDALTGSVGNLIACADKEYVYKRYNQINFLFSILSAFCTICLFVLLQPFISLWTGGGVYLLKFSTMALICVSFYVVRIRSAVMLFKDCAGLFWQNRFIPIIEAVLNIVISIVLGIFMGINGVILGTIISATLAPMLAEPYVLYKHYFKKSVWIYIRKLLIDIFITSVIAIICYYICSFIPDGTIWWLMVKFTVCIALTILLLVIAYLPTDEFKQCFIWGKHQLSKLLGRKYNKSCDMIENATTNQNNEKFQEELDMVDKSNKTEDIRIAGAVVLYNPDKDVVEHINTYLHFLERLYVMDNSTKNIEFLDEIKEIDKVEYISLNGNQGIAKALKDASEKAIAEGFNWLLTMDQDSKYPTEDFKYIKDFIESKDISKVGCIGINYNGSNWTDKDDNKTQYEEVNFNISSGMLINLEAYQQVLGFREELFIDLVDFDICLQFQEKGFKIILFKNIILEHNLGEMYLGKFLFKKVLIHSHTPLRYYYIYRNYSYLKKHTSATYNKYLKKEAKRFTFIYSIKLALLEKHTFKTLTMMLKGRRDGKRAILGKYGEKVKKKD